MILTVFFSLFAWGQNDTARLQGTITDQQKAEVANATVTVTSVLTGRAVSVQSSPSGTYAVPGLKPGRYTVKVESGNFRQVHQEITLQTAQIADLNFTLQPGTVTETVEVNSDVPLVETGSSKIGEVITGPQIVDLPLNGRNFTQLALLNPGVTRGSPGNQATGSGNQAETFRYGESGGAALSVNGLRPQNNNFLLDGIDNNESLVNTIIFFPPAEAIQEFRVDTSIAPAEFGRAGGAIVNTSIRSGTNSWHGSAFEFLRNDNLDARDFFDKATVDPLTGKVKPKNEFRRNQFGGSLGGAIIKGKLFIFGDYQGLRQFRPLGVDYASVPTALMRQGNFSELSQPIYDPTTNLPFTGNIIPSNRISKVGQNYLNAYPAPNCGPALDPACHTLTQNYKVSRSQIQGFDDFDVRADWNIREKDTTFARYSYGRDIETTSSRLPALPAGFGSGNQENHPRSIALGETHVFSPNLVNEFRAGWIRTRYGYVPPFEGEKISATLGIPGANPTSLLGGGALIGGYNNQLEYSGDFGPYLVPQNTFQYSDALSWTKGKHNWKFGAIVLRRQVNLFRPNRGKGYFFLLGNGSGGYNVPYRITGYEVSDVLAGFVDNYQIGPPFGTVGTRNWETGYYAQDDWKLSRRLTLNFGVRYDLYTWPVEVQNRQANFDVTTGKLVVASDSNRGFVPTDKNNFAPRIGFAYDLGGNGRTVLRGGYGIFYFLDRGGIDNQLAQNPPYSGFSQFNFNNGFHINLGGMVQGTQGLLNPALPGSTSNPFVCYTGCDATAVTGTLPQGSVNNVDVNNPQNVTVFATLPSNRNSYVQQWNLQVQESITNNTALTVAYVGTKGTKLTNYFNMNRDPYGGGLKLFPNLGNVNVQDTNGSSIYHGLQTRLERRLTNGVQFTASYTWSHTIDDAPGAFDNPDYGVVDFRNLPLERGNSGLDQRHRFTFSSLLELPFGNGRHMGSGWTGPKNAVLGGWNVNPIVVLGTGYPFDLNNGFARPDIVGAPQVNQNFDPVTGQLLWFNPKAFVSPTGRPGTLGRNRFYGPGTKTVDLTVAKNFKVTERVTTQFRSEFFNLFNTPQFGQPDVNINDSNFGTINSARTYTERQIQFALRVSF